ncbi:leucine-rich repeat domain-containing protein [Candidatus Microgenomates bacterium]|nr:MAG: leucine-rich repeat domain-containing protein [Candidatus Microgenomates bacterium]
MPKKSKSAPKKHRARKQSKFAYILAFLGLAVLAVLIYSTNTINIKIPSVSLQNVLGENISEPCSSGGLTTSTNKVFQMAYPDETFQQLTNTDLLKDVSQLKDLTCLQYLDATDRTVKGDIADLKNLLNLEVFSLYSNPDVTGDICSLVGATKLRSLKFAFDPKITGDISCLKNLTNLETFAMTHTQIKGDISVFANMPNLKAIYISGTNLKGNICSLSKLTNLEELGIADEYPGNPDITGDLGCLKNLQKLKRVSIYNTSTTNCEQFTKSHPDLAKTITESGKQGGGGCSKESMKTMVDYGQKYEAKIGKEVQTEVRGQPNYNKEKTGGFGPENNTDEKNNSSQIKDDRNFLQKLIGSILGIFGVKTESSENGLKERENGKGGGSREPMPEGAVGPGGCKSQAQCDKYCDKQEHRDECSKFAPAENSGR